MVPGRGPKFHGILDRQTVAWVHDHFAARIEHFEHRIESGRGGNIDESDVSVGLGARMVK